MSEVKIFSTILPPVPRPERREAERKAVAALILEAFGPEARLAHDPHGRPYIEGQPDVYISISHSDAACLLAVSDTPVGIDIEAPREQLARISSKYLTPGEYSRGPHDIDTLLRYWTAKEAVFKCAGIPSLVISEIEVSSDLTQATARSQQYTIRHTPTPTGLIAIANRG